jgi:hypothetical protein
MKIQKEALSTSELNNTSPINQKEVNKKRLIFEVHEGHNSKQTADKYRTSFKLFLDYIEIQFRRIFRLRKRSNTGASYQIYQNIKR